MNLRERLEKAKKTEQQKVFGARGSKKGLPKYLDIVEGFAKKMNLEPVRVTPPKELESMYGKPVKEISGDIKAKHNWKKAGSTGNYIFKPSFFEKDGKWHVAHLGTAKSLIHELAHIVRTDKSIPDLDAAMQSGFGKIKVAGLKAKKEAKLRGETEEAQSQASKMSNQFAWPGEYETMGLEQLMARHLGLPVNVTAVYTEDPAKGKPGKDVQLSMKTGEPIHRKIPAGEGRTKHITHLSENVPDKLKAKWDRITGGELEYKPESGWHENVSPDTKINVRARKMQKSTLKKDNKPHPEGSPEDRAHDVVEEGKNLNSELKAAGSSGAKKRLLEHLRAAGGSKDGWMRDKANQKAGGEKLEKKQGVPKGVDPQKYENCIHDVKKQSPDVNPYAVCNASLQKGDEFDYNSQMRNRLAQLKSKYGEKKPETPAQQEKRVKEKYGLKKTLDLKERFEKLKKKDLNSPVSSSGGVGIILVNEKGQILMGRQMSEAGKFTFPGGSIDKGESLKEAAARELAEETGVKLTDDEIQRMQPIYLSNRENSFILQIDRTPEHGSSSELADVGFYEPSEIDLDDIRPCCISGVTAALSQDMDEMEKAAPVLFSAMSGLAKAKKKSSKPFHGYNKKKHSRTGGLSDSYRKKYNRETGSNLKRPVTGKVKRGSKAAKRRKSFCARMKNVRGATSKGGKLTPKGASLKRWGC